MYDIVIIGAGTAGLTAAIYACRANKKVLVLESDVYGGQIVKTLRIENYPATPHISGVDFAKSLYAQATNLGAEIEFEEVVKIENYDDRKIVVTADNTYETATIVIATGSHDKKLGLDREDELFGHGVSYCATCDGALYSGKDVAVVGGGNTALYEALYLCDIAKKVYLIHRRDEFRGDLALVDKVHKKANVEFIMNSTVTELFGDKKLDRVEITDTTDGKVSELRIAGLFIAVGREPSTRIFRDIVELDSNGYIKTDEACHTNIPGIFAAGDVRTKDLRQLVTATSDGAIAATEAVRYLNQK